MTTADGDRLGGARVRFGPEIFRLQAYGGVNRYVIEVHKGLLDRKVDSQIVAGLHLSPMLDGVPEVAGVRLAGPRPRALAKGAALIASRAVAASARRRLRPPAIWHPSYYGPVGHRSAALAVTVYDMVHERFPQEISRRDPTPVHKAPMCRSADVVFCISQATAQDLEERLGIDRDRVVVTHLGVRHIIPSQIPPPFDELPYVVFVGNRRPRYKNWRALLDALREAPSALGLVCIGAPVTALDQAEIAARSLGDRVRFESADDRALANRYAGSLGLVYPSLYEGFGLPPLEALIQGCPVVASSVGAIPEIVGDIALMVEPTADAIGDGLMALLRNGPEIQRQRIEGPSHAARFTWDETVAKTISGYRRALKDHASSTGFQATKE